MRRYDVIGIDLAARRPSSLAGFIRGDGIWLWRSEASKLLENDFRAEIVVIDAPLSLPRIGGFRDFERELISRGYRLLPASISSMRDLAMLGIELKRKLEGMGSTVLETHPSSVIKVLKVSSEDIVLTLSRFGFHPKDPRSKDDVDALICLLVGMLYQRGEVEFFRGEEGFIVLPRLNLDIESVLGFREHF